jgi:hypothetical protein
MTKAIRPGDLSRAITALAAELEKIAITKTPAPIPRRVNKTFNYSIHPEVSGDSTNRRSRRI